MKSACARVASGRNTATRWQFWKASRTPYCRSIAPRIASLPISRSSWPRAASSGGGTWLSANSPPPASRSVTRPAIRFQAYGSEVRTQSRNAASSTSPRCARSRRSAGTASDIERSLLRHGAITLPVILHKNDNHFNIMILSFATGRAQERSEGSVKIAFAGKGGSVKTTLSSLFVRHLADQGLPGVAVDAHINQHLAEALGASEPPPLGAHLTQIKEYLRGTNPR